MFLLSLVFFRASFILLVKEKKGRPDGKINFWKNIKDLPLNFKLFVFSVGIFGLGNFAHTLLILRTSEILTPEYGKTAAISTSIGLYTLHNILYAAYAYPARILSEKNWQKDIAWSWILSLCIDVSGVYTGASQTLGNVHTINSSANTHQSSAMTFT